jgi:hypothetical protein
MDRFVEIRFQGRFDHFFVVTYQIFDSSSQIIERGEAALPPCPELVADIKNWRGAYQADVKQPRFEHLEVLIKNSSDIDHSKSASDLKQSLNDWLSSPEFLPVKDKLMSKLDPDQVILVGIDVADPELKYAPWHLWDFFEAFPKADFALLRPSFSQVNTKSRQRSKLNILAIIGDSKGINTKEDTTVIKNLPYINDLKIMGEPSKRSVREVLGGAANIDILFFAGHGKKMQDQGEICINRSDSLSIGEIKSALRKRIKQGLQLAIFNSCDGLELGEAIADLHIPQAIVMKEVVPDQIAQRFLKSFLQEFSQGIPFVQALRRSRDKLAKEDHEYPYASWLPVLYCNPTEPLLQWPKPNFVQRYPWRTGLAASCLIGLVGLLGVGLTAQWNRTINTINNNLVESTNNFKPYEDSLYKFQLTYPHNWEVQNISDVVSGDILQVILSSDRDVVVSLNIRDIADQNMTLEEFRKLLPEKFHNFWSDFKIINQEERTTLSNRPSYKIVFSVNKGGKVYQKASVFTLKNNKAYIITYSASEELFSKYEPVANQIINSLKLAD